ncbi:MAG TPA: hypothetical protein EYN66_20930, partial [Myxococcales bacterium]|nr:hypothetical protein [Myxococcales bacterium]
MPLLGIALAVCAMVACGDNTTGTNTGGTCLPNTTLQCDCVGGFKGVQECMEDGTSYSKCDCDDGSGIPDQTPTPSNDGA